MAATLSSTTDRCYPAIGAHLAGEMITLLEAELGALRIWQAAKTPAGSLALPDDVWDGISISIDKIETVLRQAGIDDPSQAGK